MLTIIRGTTDLQEQANALAEKLKTIETEGTAYIGFTLPSTPDSERSVDLLLIGKKFGLVLFSIVDMSKSPVWKQVAEDVDQLHFIVTSFLMQSVQLRAKRNLALEFNSIAVVSDINTVDAEFKESFIDLDTLEEYLSTVSTVPDKLWGALNAVLDNVTQIKPARKRPKAKTVGSLGTVMKDIERQIANMDAYQRKAALEIPAGPQRIRGLAGSGKTVVLARKAALLHRMYPDWDIAVTFHTRSLYQQFTDLIRRFAFEYTRDEPDWTKLRVMHAWGSFNRTGVYSEIAGSIGVTPRDFGYAAASYGSSNAFQGICEELLVTAKQLEVEPLYDAILVDEAQDLPPSFFQLIYEFSKEKKRIIWAYDEMQNLMGSEMPSLVEMFGTDAEGKPRLCLDSQPDEPDRDLVLPVCYRNTPWAIAIAHSLGMGVYHGSGRLVQHFRDPSMWLRNGYEIVSGALERGEYVCLQRDPGSYPEYFANLIKPEDSVVVEVSLDKAEEYDWVAKSIQSNLDKGELEYDDILIVFLTAATAKKQAAAIAQALSRFGIKSHLAGVNTSPDEVYKSDSIAMANIFRAKGNEAAMVYIVDTQDAGGVRNREAKRNALFTAVTRSRSWVRLCGYGLEMSALAEEINKLRAANYELRFTVPTLEEQEKLRSIQVEDTAGITRAKKLASENAKSLVDLLRQGDIAFKDLPKEIQQELKFFTATEPEDSAEDI